MAKFQSLFGSTNDTTNKDAETKQSEVSDEFAPDVEKASRMLGYLISEAHSCHVKNEVIEDVEACRQILIDAKSPSEADRAKIKRAIRDLVEVPRTSVSFDGSPPPVNFWVAGSPWPWVFVIFGVIPTVVWLAALYMSSSRGDYWYLLPIFCGAASFAFAWGLSLFTGVVTDRKLNRMVGCCYILTIVALLASILPFAIPSIVAQFSNSQDAPLSVLQGCALARQVATGQGQSGGTQATPGTGAAGSSANIPEEVLCGGDRTAANAPGENIQWVVNLGGVAEPKQSSSKSPVYQVRGGVVVPLYVIVLALFGSAISMTRRVPEYQQRAMDSQDALTNVEARQRLVFQFMQVLSAPLIAITVYYIYKPAVPAESVVIGFGSGFASEPILLMIRGLVEKLSPAQAVPQGQVSVRVDPDSVALGPKQTKQFTAKVQGSNNQDVTWHISPPEAGSGTISQSGLYYAPDVKVDTAVTITAQSVADRSKSGSATVKLSPVAVKVDPLTAKVKVTTTKQFGAEVSGLANSKVTWEFDHPPSNPGTISEAGLYTAPPSSPGSPVTIKATSSADPTISGSATITVEA